MVQRYGDFVLYRPPVKSSTWLLWVGPFLLLGAALVGLILTIRRRRGSASAPLQGDEAERVRRLLGEEKSLSMALFWAIAAALLLLATVDGGGHAVAQARAGAQGAKRQPVEPGGAEGPVAADRPGPGAGQPRRGAAPGRARRDRAPRARGGKRRHRARARRFAARHPAVAAGRGAGAGAGPVRADRHAGRVVAATGGGARRAVAARRWRRWSPSWPSAWKSSRPAMSPTPKAGSCSGAATR